MMTVLQRLSSLALALVFSLLLGGCSWGVWDFLRDKDKVRPDDLVNFDEEVRMRRNWSISVGDGEGKRYNRLKPALAGDRLFVVSVDGEVVAVSTDRGRREWRTELDDVEVTGGVGVGGGLVLVGTQAAEVFALDAATGEVRWQAPVSSEVLSAPATDGRVVVVQSIDGRLTGLDARNGNPLWTYEIPVPALSLRGTSSPLINANFVISAQAGGSVVSLALDNGTLRWEERVAIPTGNSDIDRLVDIDGDLVINDAGLLLVPSYQGYLSAIDAVTGQTRWRVEESSAEGASFGFGNIYVVAEDDTVKAYRVGTDEPQWTNDQLSLRQLSAPLGFSNYVAVGDYEGYVHLLAQSDGRFVGRTKVDGDGVRSHMLAQGNTLFVYGNGGNLVSYTVQ
ncbi:MAG: outer membrane protein assembly factor BamB [Pseudohongiellaceae bacterium]|jgi:outer membrane protein assembly factor BamB